MDAPEKIWIDVEPYELHWHEGEPPAGYVHARGPYTRTDRANELVAAAYDDAASECADQFAAHMVAAISVAASLAAAISLLENGGKNAAPSDRMFEQMLKDYRKSLDDFRALIAKDKANG